MEKQEFALFVDEVNSFTPCIIDEDRSKLFHLTVEIIKFSLRFTKEQQGKILEAIKFSAECHKGQYRINKITPYIIHPLETAVFAIEIGIATYRRLVAAILHDNIEDEENGRKRTVIRKTIKKKFGFAISQIVNLLSKSKHPAQRNRFFINLSEEPNLIYRVDAILLKFCDRIKNAATFYVFNPKKKREKIEETNREFPKLAVVLDKTLKKLDSQGRLGKNTDKFIAIKMLDYLFIVLEPYK